MKGERERQGKKQGKEEGGKVMSAKQELEEKSEKGGRDPTAPVETGWLKGLKLCPWAREGPGRVKTRK